MEKICYKANELERKDNFPKRRLTDDLLLSTDKKSMPAVSNIH
jgi:hypothetical protein